MYQTRTVDCVLEWPQSGRSACTANVRASEVRFLSGNLILLTLADSSCEQIDEITLVIVQKRAAPNFLQVGALRIDPHKHRAYLNEEKLYLTPTEFRLVECFLREPGRAFTRLQLMEVLRRDPTIYLERSIDVHMRSLRMKLGTARDLIETVRGVGYRLRDEADPTKAPDTDSTLSCARRLTTPA
jgi:DNA-binding response OmpR family regulator